MNRNISYVLVIISIFFGVFSAKADTIPEEFRLSAVKFIGVKQVSKKELAKTLAVKAPSKWRFWKSKPILNRVDLEKDLLRIKQFYQRKGYYHTDAAFVVLKTDTAPPPTIGVTFTVTEGPPVIIQAIEIKPEIEIKDISVKDLAVVFPLKKDNIFDTDLYNEGKKKLAKAYGNQGHPFAKVTGKVLVSKDENTANMTLQIDPGKQHRFGKLKITENEGYVKDIVIQRAMRFKEDDIYNTDKVEQSQRNLYNSWNSDIRIKKNANFFKNIATYCF